MEKEVISYSKKDFLLHLYIYLGEKGENESFIGEVVGVFQEH
jgi:hypothetical protein